MVIVVFSDMVTPPVKEVRHLHPYRETPTVTASGGGVDHSGAKNRYDMGVRLRVRGQPAA